MPLTRALLILCLLTAPASITAASETTAAEGRQVAATQAAPSGSALPTLPGYTEVRRLPSPHATQAAAADATRLFAISNTTVATYDRETGQLLATATAAGTEHLNSGFFHEGKLYAAHSNYPELPHASDIRVFDPETNTLSVHHVFPDPPGSLVWCLHHDGHWWCCFAWYGDDNARSMLIEYADDGFDTETRRLTFPADVIADFDGMSASGGVFDGDTILASHHHFPVLYRLRIPDDPEATSLELSETLACPFPGQGIATDPATPGGLVGIDRPARSIVIAEPVTPPCCKATPSSRRGLILQSLETR